MIEATVAQIQATGKRRHLRGRARDAHDLIEDVWGEVTASGDREDMAGRARNVHTGDVGQARKAVALD